MLNGLPRKSRPTGKLCFLTQNLPGFLAIALCAVFMMHGSPSFASDKADLPQLANETLSNPDSADAGRKIFAQNCTYCHGSKGSGGKAKKLQCRTDLTAPYVFETITLGRPSGAYVMPPWGDTFTEKERWELVAFILSLGSLPTCNGD